MFNIDINKLNELEIEIYKYVLKNKDKIVYMTIRELAEELHMSTASILRFCKKNNFDGFTEFKLNLKKEVKNQKIKTTIGEIDILDEFSKSIPMIEESIKKAAKIVYESKSVLFVGTGSSGTIATYGAKYMSHFNKFALSVDDPYYPFNSTALEGGIAIILSISGENSSILEVAEKLKIMKVKTLSITNKKTNNLAKLTDYTINYYISQEGYKYPEDKFLGYSDVTSQLPALYIVERLAKEVSKLLEAKEK